MAVYTKILKHLNSKWFINSCLENKVYCGISKTNITDDISVQDALMNSSVFLKVTSQFIEESSPDDYNSKMLTKQIYYNEQNVVAKHTFLDNVCYWKVVSNQDAQYKKIFNVNSFFVCNNIYEEHYNDFKNLKSFCFFYNLKIDNVLPEEDQIFKNNESDYSAEEILLKENIGFTEFFDNGVCDNITNDVSVPEGYMERFNYFLNF